MNSSLLRALVVREFKGRYRRSMLGPLWAVAQPLAYVVIFTFLQGVLSVDTNGVPRVLFIFSALVPWTFLSNSISRSASSVFSNAGIIKKMKVRAELFPLSSVVLSGIDLLISLALLVGMVLYFSCPITMNILWLAVLIVIAAALAFSIGLACSALGTFRRDITYIIPFLLQFWMLVTPVFYPLANVPPNLRAYYLMNPMVGIVEGFRGVVIRGVAPDMAALAVSVLVTCLVFAFAWPMFKFTARYYADAL